MHWLDSLLISFFLSASSSWKKTLIQAMIISGILVSAYTFLVIYSLAEQIVPAGAGNVEKYLDFGNPLVLESLPGIALISLWYFCILTIIVYLVIYLVKKLKKSKT